MSRRYMEDDCSRPGRPRSPACPGGLELAQAYIPYQEYTKSYCPEEALQKGTMFPELYRPYDGRGKMYR